MHNDMMTLLQNSDPKANAPTRLAWALILLLVGGSLAGCKSPPSGGDGSLAWVEITGHTSAEIKKAAEIVFEDDGYHVAVSSPMRLTFAPRLPSRPRRAR